MILKVFDFKKSCGNIVNLDELIRKNTFKGIPILTRGTETCIGKCIGNKIFITPEGLYTDCIIHKDDSVNINKMHYYANYWEATYTQSEDYDNISDMIYKELKERSRIHVNYFKTVIYQDM